MAVENIVESLDKVEQSIRSAYVERDGKFHLDADKYADIKAEGLKAKNRELMGKARLTRTSEERVLELEAELKHFKLTEPIRALLGQVGIMSDRFEPAFEYALKHFRLEDDGEISVIDRNGNALNVSPRKFLETTFKDANPWAYEASKAAGSGAHSGNRSSGSSSQRMSREAFERLSDAEKISFSNAGGTLYDSD